jgi:hypothetical protein
VFIVHSVHPLCKYALVISFKTLDAAMSNLRAGEQDGSTCWLYREGMEPPTANTPKVRL